MDFESKEVVALNENVLIEIGAPMALYGRPFYPAGEGLQGMFELRYSADKLDGNKTIRLMPRFAFERVI